MPIISPESINRAKIHMPEGSRLYYMIRHSTNYNRWLSFYAIVDGRIQDITGFIARVLNKNRHDKHGSSISVNYVNSGVDVAELIQKVLEYKTKFEVEQLH